MSYVANPTDATFNYCFEDSFQIEDIENRNLFINAQIDEHFISTVVYHIMRYNRLDKDIPIEERQPIKVFINSPGGTIVDGYGIIDAILTSQTPVYTINLAQCASMAFDIFLSGDKRFAMPHSEFLMHDGSSFGCDSMAKLQDRISFETTQLRDMAKELILGRTNISEELYQNKYRVEWYFLPKEGKELGVVDYIIGEDCEIDEIL